MTDDKSLLPVARGTDMETMQRAYEETTRKLLKDNDWQTIPGQQGRRFLKRSGWRKLATAYGVSLTIESVEILRDENQRVISAQVVARAVHDATGRTVDGWGACSYEERRFSKREHDIPAVAETRAKNRALADMFGIGEPSVEELETDMPLATDEEVSEIDHSINTDLNDEQRKTLRRWWIEHQIPPINSGRLFSYHIDQINEWIGVLVDTTPVEKE